jgi:3-oxoadipate enol-lactonase
MSPNSAVEVPYRVDGPEDAPVLVLSNSLGSTSAMWDPQVPALTERFRLVRYEIRGHDSAPVPDGPYSLDDLGGDVVALLDRLGLERVSFAGLSLGGMTGMWLGVNAPERIDRLVLMCTSAMLSKEHDWPLRARTVREKGTGAVAEAVVERWFTPAYVDANPDVAKRMRAMVADTPAEGYAGCCEAIAGIDLTRDIARIRAPTLVVSAAQDPVTPPSDGRLIAGAIPGARLEVVDPGAHLSSIERHDVVTQLIVDHLGGAA